MVGGMSARPLELRRLMPVYALDVKLNTRI